MLSYKAFDTCLDLQDMCKHYDSESPGYDTIREALESMVDIAKHINEMKRKHETAIHVQEIQSQLHGMQVCQNCISSFESKGF